MSVIITSINNVFQTITTFPPDNEHKNNTVNLQTAFIDITETKRRNATLFFFIKTKTETPSLYCTKNIYTYIDSTKYEKK